MTESTKPGRGRARRSTRVSRQLEEARRRNAQQLALQRKREQRVEEALAVFFNAGDQLVAAEQECRRRIEPHERAIAQLREQCGVVAAAQEATQARAALAIHEADRTVEQVGELLEVSEKAARRLIAAGREAVAKDTNGEQAQDGAPSTEVPSAPTADARRESRGDDAPDDARSAALGATPGRSPWPGAGRDLSATAHAARANDT